MQLSSSLKDTSEQPQPLKYLFKSVPLYSTASPCRVLLSYHSISGSGPAALWAVPTHRRVRVPPAGWLLQSQLCTTKDKASPVAGTSPQLSTPCQCTARTPLMFPKHGSKDGSKGTKHHFYPRETTAQAALGAGSGSGHTAASGLPADPPPEGSLLCSFSSRAKHLRNAVQRPAGPGRRVFIEPCWVHLLPLVSPCVHTHTEHLG